MLHSLVVSDTATVTYIVDIHGLPCICCLATVVRTIITGYINVKTFTLHSYWYTEIGHHPSVFCGQSAKSFLENLTWVDGKVYRDPFLYLEL